MKKVSWVASFIVVVILFLSMNQSNQALGNTKKYPIICKNELVTEPKNATLEKVDINSDKLIDLVAILPWGGSDLYINCGNGQYYRAIRSAGKIKIESNPKGIWSHIFIDTSSNESSDSWDKDTSTLVDGQVYRADSLELGNIFEANPSNPDEYIMKTGEALIKFDGLSYKPTYKNSKRLEVYAPYYRFEYQNSSDGRMNVKKVTSIYIELPEGKYKIYSNKQSESKAYNRIDSIEFAELNGDNSLDAIVNYYYDDGGSAGRENYAALLLNCGDNSYIYSGKIGLGSNHSKIQSRKVSIDGKIFTAVVCKQFSKKAQVEKGVQDKYDVYIYHPKLKEFLRVSASMGRDSSTFVPLSKKQFEDNVNPPLLRSDSGSLSSIKVDESAITTLIGNYEKSLVDAVNTNNFSLVEKYLTSSSNLYKSQKSLVSKLYEKKTQEKLVEYKVEKIKATNRANNYQAYVTEKIGIKKVDKADFAVSEFRWIYTVVFDETKYSLSDIAKWDGK